MTNAAANRQIADQLEAAAASGRLGDRIELDAVTRDHAVALLETRRLRNTLPNC